MYQSAPELHAYPLIESSPKSHRVGFIIPVLKIRMGLEFIQVTQGQNLEPNLVVSDFRAGVLTFKLQRREWKIWCIPGRSCILF